MLCACFRGVRECRSTVLYGDVYDVLDACMHMQCTAHCILTRAMPVTALKIESITRILGEYSLGL